MSCGGRVNFVRIIELFTSLCTKYLNLFTSPKAFDENALLSTSTGENSKGFL